MDLFATESVQLQDRLGRQLTLEIGFRHFRQRYALLMCSPAHLPARQLQKNAEHIARQLLQRLGIEPECADFLHLQAGQWRRWRFRWVGLSPRLMGDEMLNESARNGYVRQFIEQGQELSMAATNCSAVNTAQEQSPDLLRNFPVSTIWR